MKKFIVLLLVFAVAGVYAAYDEGFDVDGNWSSGGTAYTPKTYEDASGIGSFDGSDVVRETTTTQAGNYAWRLDDNDPNYFRYEADTGIVSFTVYTAGWDVSDSGDVTFRYSVNESTYTDLLVTNETYYTDTGDKVYKQFSSGDLNITPDSGKKIWLEVYNDGGSGAMLLVDTFSVTVIPEPMLLGLLPLALFFFRRK